MHHNAPNDSSRRAWVSVVLALVALVASVVCILSGQTAPGLIFVFAAVAGVMTAWQVRERSMRS
jgi:hypothetical protein